MGSTETKIIDALNRPEDEESLRKVFDTFDTDHDGLLNRQEWKQVGKYLWQAAIKNARNEIRKEGRDPSLLFPKSRSPNHICLIIIFILFQIYYFGCMADRTYLWTEDLLIWSPKIFFRGPGF
jgi:hypothetical protein